jgi:hypothetical protein
MGAPRLSMVMMVDYYVDCEWNLRASNGIWPDLGRAVTRPAMLPHSLMSGHQWSRLCYLESQNTQISPQDAGEQLMDFDCNWQTLNKSSDKKPSTHSPAHSGVLWATYDNCLQQRSFECIRSSGLIAKALKYPIWGNYVMLWWDSRAFGSA